MLQSYKYTSNLCAKFHSNNFLFDSAMAQQNVKSQWFYFSRQLNLSSLGMKRLCDRSEGCVTNSFCDQFCAWSLPTFVFLRQTGKRTSTYEDAKSAHGGGQTFQWGLGSIRSGLY